MSERRQLINLAYRLLGSLAEAEDAVQETYARWYAMSRQQQEAIESPGAWLTTVASRICLDLLGSARARRERYVGEWIPEPLPERTEWINGRPGNATADLAVRVMNRNRKRPGGAEPGARAGHRCPRALQLQRLQNTPQRRRQPAP
jgi:DNA-directed RNA polymerase specialized sigma24 family protein